MLPRKYQYALYLSYQFDLYPSHPWMGNMVSERYRPSANASDEDLLDSDDEDASDTEESVSNFHFVFDSFG